MKIGNAKISLKPKFDPISNKVFVVPTVEDVTGASVWAAGPLGWPLSIVISIVFLFLGNKILKKVLGKALNGHTYEILDLEELSLAGFPVYGAVHSIKAKSLLLGIGRG